MSSLVRYNVIARQCMKLSSTRGNYKIAMNYSHAIIMLKNSYLKGPIHHSLQSYLYHRQSRLVTEDRVEIHRSCLRMRNKEQMSVGGCKCDNGNLRP
jgi:hypothetical protein